MPIKVRRAGETASTWSSDPYAVNLSYMPTDGEGEASYVYLTFKMPSKGGGVTDVRVELPPDVFGQMAGSMIKADREAALVAFGRALLTKSSEDENGIPY